MVKLTDELLLKSGLKLKNRLVVPPMTVLLSFHDGTVTDEEIAHYARLSEGYGLVITATANVTENGKGWPGELTIATDDAVARLALLSSAIQKKGARAILQVFHAGRMTHQKTIGEQIVSASNVAAEVRNAEIPRELTDAEIEAIVEAFGQATRRAIAAGFDGIEIHGANMYLIHQFFSPHSNRRTDRWGGSLGKRMAFPLAVLDRVFAEVARSSKGPFIVGYRFSPVEGSQPGIQLEDTFALLDALKRYPLDYLHVSLKDYRRKSNSPNLQEKSELAYLHERLAGEIPLIAVGGLRDRAAVEGLLEHAELAGIGQQTLVDPDFAVKLLEGRDKDFVTKPFGEAIFDRPMPQPMLNYLKKRYKVE
jgi:2,4-dienoyl-CoA reductase-like NADH-dependent reductase (Old Yellow Enzyme family)